MSAITQSTDIPIAVPGRIPERLIRLIAALALASALAIGINALVTRLTARSVSAATYVDRACASWESTHKSTPAGRADAFKAAAKDHNLQPFAFYYYQLPAFTNPAYAVDGLALSAINTHYCAGR
jgi:hypothetical protein